VEGHSITTTSELPTDQKTKKPENQIAENLEKGGQHKHAEEQVNLGVKFLFYGVVTGRRHLRRRGLL
jgi:hypothetical protein